MAKKIFLSYSSRDRAAVTTLAQDLRRSGIRVWIDQTEIAVGESVTQKVQQGLSESDYLGIWLTRSAIASGWVEKEWQAKFNEEASKKRVIILPLLADEIIDLPLFLRDKRYADFRTDYSEGLSQLVHAIKGRVPEAERTIAEYTSDLLEDLSNAKIAFPLSPWLKIIPTLQSLPRSGKKIRLETYQPHLPIRSVYDHILSIAHSADSLFQVVQHGIPQQERLELARCIVYHDIAEVLLGDIPAYTNLTDAKRSRARIFAERRLTRFPGSESKRRATEFIAMFLDDKELQSLAAATRILDDEMSNIRRFFYVIDKIDPIIATWRYLHQFRGQLDPGAVDFLKRMKDFFDNPDIKSIVRGYKEDPAIEPIVLLLQDRRLARDYYNGDLSIQESLFGLPSDTLSRLIEGTSLTFVTERRKTGAHRRTPGIASASATGRAGRRR